MRRVQILFAAIAGAVFVQNAAAQNNVQQLSGTTWVGSENLQGYGKLTFRFGSGSAVTMIDAKDTVPGSWSRNGGSVTLRFFNGSVTYSGTISGRAMSGTASNGRNRWSWSVAMQGGGNGKPGRIGYDDNAPKRIPGSFVTSNAKSYSGKVVANGQCVRFVQVAANVPHTSQWKAGVKVRGRSIPKGTAIATFVNGVYPNKKSGNHAAIYDGQDANGIWVWDQWTGQPVHRRYIPFRNGKGRLSNDGDAFSVIVTGRK